MGQEQKKRRIAHASLECIEKVAESASQELKDSQTGRTDANGDNLIIEQDAQVAIQLHNRRITRIQELNEIIKEPIVARVEYIDRKKSKEVTILITRKSIVTTPDYIIAEYDGPLGSIASIPAGESELVRIPSGEIDILVRNSIQLNPKNFPDGWDSIDNVFDIKDHGTSSESSLRSYLESTDQKGAIDVNILWEEEDDKGAAGLRRSIRTHITLRDQPILDRQQDKIFRMPINSCCFLSGPPGTGKTTTLIKRLGQKTNITVLNQYPEEQALIKKVESETGELHEDNWVMFSPTELLRQYVKEAFLRERQLASDHHIRTWDNYRKELARDNLRLLKTSSGRGPFIERSSDDYLSEDTAGDPDLYDEFFEYLEESIRLEFLSDIDFFKSNASKSLRDIGERLEEIIRGSESDFYKRIYIGVRSLIPDIQEALMKRTASISKILIKARNTLTNEDQEFPDKLREKITLQITSGRQTIENDEDLDEDLEDNDEQEQEYQLNGPITKKQAQSYFEQAIKSLARSRFAGRRIRSETQNGKLLEWLGKDRVPPEEDIKKLGNLLAEQTKLRKFRRLDRLFLRRIATKYKRFRGEMNNAGRWYNTLPKKSSDIHWRELDLLILANLQIANDLLGIFQNQSDLTLPQEGVLANVKYIQKAQVLVDEATDFSLVQLASMYQISHASMRSFFLCGDINQRLTEYGVKSSKALRWIDKSIQLENITVSYRHSHHLVELAKDVARLGGSNDIDIVLPKNLDAQGVAPVWKDKLSNNEKVSAWLTSRIQEIELMIRSETTQSITIAVLVNEEEEVEPLAIELNRQLEEINLSAVACKDGQVVGNERDVRVFNIKNIKGLEFEAVFFINIDQTITQHPDLYTKYLYVGATRAATYLGITFSKRIPRSMSKLSKHFGSDWSI